MIDIILNDNISYKEISEAYNLDKDISSALRKSHTTPMRGNIPRGTTPADFYLYVIGELYSRKEKKIIFARKLYMRLKDNNIFPEEWRKYEDKINGCEETFDVDLFHDYIVSLLHIDKNNKNSVKNDDVLNEKKTLSKSESTPNTQMSSLTFSSKFFTKGPREMVNETGEKIVEEMARVSVVFDGILDYNFFDENRKISSDENWFTTVYKYAVEDILTKNTDEILKIEGPLGSYKNRVTQYLYLAIAKNNPEIIPFYIDLASYEKLAEVNKEVGEEQFLEEFRKDLKIVESIYVKETHRKPLLILDGLQDFFCREASLYYSMSKMIDKLGFKMILCVDTDFTVNEEHQYKSHPIVTENFGIYLRFRSMNLNRRNLSIQFIKNCINVFHIEIPENITPEIIYNSLVHLDFLTIDAYWLVNMLNHHLDEIVNKKVDIATLYYSICASVLDLDESIESAAEIAYEFEFGNMDNSDTNPYYDLRWYLISTHRSVLDYLIAKHIAKKLSALDINRNSEKQKEEYLSYFGLVIQKNISRFVVAMLKGNNAFEQQVMTIGEKYYEFLNLNQKSQLVFWLGRLENPKRISRATRILKDFLKEETNNYSPDNYNNLADMRDAAFLIRSICVSLIHDEDKEVLLYYTQSLMDDEIANSVNRGFNLEYYSDKIYSAKHSLLDYEDDLTKGEATFDALCISIDKKRRKKNNPQKCVAILEIMTLCNLMQARMEYRDDIKVFDISPYVEKCKKYLQWIVESGALREMRKVCSYFNWMYNILNSVPKDELATYRRSDIMNQLIRTSDVKRTGWKKYNLPHSENIAEHMYDCFLIGTFYLPDGSDEKGYCKDSILKMLMIHDIAEVQTGDISRPEKEKNRPYYDHLERTAMHNVLFAGSYPGSVSMDKYLNLWNDWDDGQSINALIAKDIDVIQTMCRFCEYYLEHPDKFTDEDIRYWLGDINRVRTDIGLDILEVLIESNPRYSDIYCVIGK